MSDLHATAGANTSVRRADAAALVNGDPSGRLGQLSTLAGSSVFSTNGTAEKVVDWDTAGCVLDTRSWCIARAGGDEAAGLAAFAAAQAGYLVRREGFEDHWQNGRSLVYGAVNVGGTGTRFGAFCAVLGDPESLHPEVLAAFPGDSVQRYTSPEGAVDGRMAAQEATSWADRASMVVIHRAQEAKELDPSEWPHMICREDRYFEAVIAHRLPVSTLTEVRMRKRLVDRLRELRSRRFLGEALTPTDDNEVRAYHAIQGWRRSHGTRLQEVS